MRWATRQRRRATGWSSAEFSLLPQVVNVEPLDNSGVKTVSTIQVAHASLVPGGVFEYQHSSGTDIRDSFAKGFKSWAEHDLPVFLDAQRAEAADLHGHGDEARR